MNDVEPPIQIGTPLYLITSSEHCWRCKLPQSVIALATRSLRDGDMDMLVESTEDEEPFILTNITDMPESIFQHLTTVHPSYRQHPSRTAGQTYYANMCECGANFGDFYLHSEPGGAFFPMSEEQAAEMTVTALPFEGVFDFHCGYSQGRGDFIFQHAKRAGMIPPRGSDTPDSP